MEQVNIKWARGGSSAALTIDEAAQHEGCLRAADKEDEVMELSDAKKAIRRNPPTFGLMKISQAAALAGLHPETLRRRVRRGELTAWGFPRRVALADVLEQFNPPGVREVVENGRK